MKKKGFYIFTFFAFLFCSSQEITDKEVFNKCRKEFNKKTCLADDDQDGVLNYLDQCKNEAGAIEMMGCPFPDTDGDGIVDKDDACPGVAGPSENTGCPWSDTDGDGTLDKDDACPTVPGIPEKNGCPKETYTPPYRYSKEELEEVKKTFLENTKNLDYNKLADFIFSKIDKNYFKDKLITIKVASFSQMPGCGQDRTDYSPYNFVVNLASERFWNENNFKKFANKFPNNVIFLYSEKEDVFKKIQSYKKINSKKINGNNFYNARNNFRELNKQKINYQEPFFIDLNIEEDSILIRINEEYKFFTIKNENNKFTEIK